MKEVKSQTKAWQPFTFRGVGLFSQAPGGSLWAMMLVFALVLGGVVGVIFFFRYVPRLDEAISNLPQKSASIFSGRLAWPGEETAFLSEGPFLGIAVDPVSQVDPVQTADLQITLAPREVIISSMFGYMFIPYLRDYSMNLTQPFLHPIWGAWREFSVLGMGLLAAMSLGITWLLLAFIYFLPVRLVGYYLDRNYTLKGAYKLSCAALMPAASMMGVGLILYSQNEFTLPGLSALFIIHVLVQWIYLVGGIFRAPKISTIKKNPFDDEDTAANELER